jgi:putative peptide zinc metalloprotease protein
MDQIRSNRPLRLKARTDLQVEWQTYQGRESVVIKDPISLRYFRFEPEEYSILQSLDGQMSAAAVKEKFERQFSPQRLTFAELQQFVGMMHRNGLLISDSPGQGTELHKRKLKNEWQQKKSSWMSLMAIRFRGFDPDHLLTKLNRVVGWIFSGPTAAVAVVMVLMAAALVFTNFETFANKLPTFREFFAGKNWLPLAIVLGVTKVIHEFGHGISCKRFGGQCHEMGFMLLVFSPCLYCNVSDAWMLPSKWKRIAISAAGMYLEIIMASLATFVWWYSQPGIVNQLALNVVFVCSVTTLLFNANPLMRYDGYYVLSDLVEVPNLRQKSASLLNGMVVHWLFGLPGRVDPFLPTRRRWMFIAYSIASTIYRWVITFSIFWFLYRVLEPYGFKIIGQMLAMMTLITFVLIPVLGVKKFFSMPGRWGAVNRVRLSVAGGIAAAAILGIFAIPLPHYVNCSCYFQSQGTESLYVESPGYIEQILVHSGERVEADAPLLQLANSEKEVELVRLAGEASIAKVHFLNVSAASVKYDKYARELLTADARKNAAESKLALMEVDRQRLLIRAPRSGIFIAAVPKERQSDDEGNLGGWAKSPTDPQNLGAYLESQTLVGQIIPDTNKVEAVLAIDQSEIEFIQSDQIVKIWSRQLPGKCFKSRTGQVSPTKMRIAPRQLSIRAGGDLQTLPNREGYEEPTSATYQVNVPLETDGVPILTGATGVAKVQVGSQTVGRRLWRLLCQTFRFEL